MLVERMVVRRNVTAPRPDASYLTELSDDAMPTLVGALPRLSPAAQDAVREELCERADVDAGWWGANRSTAAASHARAEVCR